MYLESGVDNDELGFYVIGIGSKLLPRGEHHAR